MDILQEICVYFFLVVLKIMSVEKRPMKNSELCHLQIRKIIAYTFDVAHGLFAWFCQDPLEWLPNVNNPVLIFLSKMQVFGFTISNRILHICFLPDTKK